MSRCGEGKMCRTQFLSSTPFILGRMNQRLQRIKRKHRIMRVDQSLFIASSSVSLVLVGYSDEGQ